MKIFETTRAKIKELILIDKKLGEEFMLKLLKNEAKKRGFKDGCTFKSGENWTVSGHIQFVYKKGHDTLELWCDIAETRNDGYICKVRGKIDIYENGKWAELLPSTPDITINGYKAEFKEGSVKIGCQSITKNVISDLTNTAKYFKNSDYPIEAMIFGGVRVSMKEIEEINNYFTKGE